MDFSVVALSAADQQFLERAQRFLATHGTDDLPRRERETGGGFIAELHLAMGAAGWLEPEAKGADALGLGRPAYAPTKEAT
ncbi:hypothetical protein [Mycobacterium sp.]|uniref:hypothetical protein n=1 Tax=Mycobacterium sp. TaxID=1785 RepID=UPI002B54ECBE|nr:hypothetical protein [Mycobacterium sp.]HTQ20252.1 hypothetical protein [Mycobacterium sp.]